MSVIDGDKIAIPVSISDVSQLLGASSFDLGTLCTHDNINMWAKYKPVPLKDVVGLPDELNGNDSWKGNPMKETGEPWWFGQGGINAGIPTYEIPVINNIDDIGKDGIQKSSGAWSYNKPTGKGQYVTYPYRLTDFIGYKHNARPPFTASIPTSLYLGNQWQSFGLSVNDNPENGEFSIDDIKGMLGLEHIYVGICFYNRTTGIVSAAVNNRELSMNDDDSWWFNLRPGNDAPILGSGGVGMTINEHDTVDVYLFLSTSVGANSLNEMTKYSVLIDPNQTVYRRISGNNVTEPVYQFNGTYSYDENWQPTYIGAFTPQLYYSEDGVNVFSYDAELTNANANVIANLSIGSSYNGYYKIYLHQYGYLPSGARFDFPVLQLYSEQRTFQGSYAVNLSSHRNMMNFISYNTANDASAQENGTPVVSSLPLFKEVIYNDTGDGETGVVTGRKAYIEVAFIADNLSVKWEKTSGMLLDVENLLK